MGVNTKSLIIFTFLLIIVGFGFLWFGLPTPNIASAPPPLSTPVAEIPQVATSSARPLTPEPARQSPDGSSRMADGPSDGERAVVGVEGERVVVTKVVDGDTIQIDSGKTVRFVGIDTPETVDPRRPVGCFGKEASNEVKSLLTNKTIVLQKDVSETDKYGRLLRYIYLPLDDGRALFVNDYLVREGFAHVYTYPPDVKFNEQFIEAEKEAREQNRGLWSRC